MEKEKKFDSVYAEFSIKTILENYLECALWTAELDDRTIFEVSKASAEKAEKEIVEFVKKAGELLYGLTDEQIGHDIWLSRNGHGAGFFDRELGGKEKQLQEIARGMGERNVFADPHSEIIIE